MNSTNVWDVLAIALGLSFAFAVLAGTAYLIQAHGWSAWWFLVALMIVSSISIKTGG